MKFSREQIEAVVKAKGYAWFEGTKDFDLNIVGIRNSSTGTAVTNLFDDWMTVSYKENGEWKFFQWNCTTDPGTKAVMEFHAENGVARVVPGQYRGSHMIGLHQGKYEALKQQKPVKVYRDKNKDKNFDTNVIEEGIFGINIHRSSATGTSTYVENWSEGCQVFANIEDFNKFMTICRKAKDIHGNSFTYTLIESSDIV
jgi:hypothetical protein